MRSFLLFMERRKFEIRGPVLNFEVQDSGKARAGLSVGPLFFDCPQMALIPLIFALAISDISGISGQLQGRTYGFALLVDRKHSHPT